MDMWGAGGAAPADAGDARAEAGHHRAVGVSGGGVGAGSGDDAAAAAAYSNVKGRLAAMAVELDGKQQTIDLLKRAKMKEARQLRRQGAAEVAEVKAEAEAQRQQLEEALSRQLKFVDELLKDKKTLQARVQSMADEMAVSLEVEWGGHTSLPGGGMQQSTSICSPLGVKICS